MSATPDPIADLERWELHGGSWRTLSITASAASVQLSTCHGEPADELRSADPALLAYLSRRSSSEAESLAPESQD